MQQVSIGRVLGAYGRIAAGMVAASAAALSIGCGGGGGGGSIANQPFWAGYGRSAQHTAISDVSTVPLTKVKWTHTVDATNPTGTIYIHYGSPSITRANTIIVPVRTGASSFRFDALAGATGTQLWTTDTDYIVAPHDWVPSCSGVISPSGRFYYPGAGGTILYRDAPDSATPPTNGTGRIVFYGTANYAGANIATYNANLYINTPITADSAGNIYFGVMSTGATPTNTASSIVKIDKTGVATAVSITSLSADMTKIAHNCAPAVSNDGTLVYFGINNTNGSGASAGYLVALKTSNLTIAGKIKLKDPKSGNDAGVYDAGTASPTVGPDGDVYYGVLESPFGGNHGRGFMLHYDSQLVTTKTPAAFGWDDTASIVPATMVPSYKGASTYLLCIKYNNYADGGGDGHNRVAVVDPGQSAVESISGVTCMAEVLTVLGPTPDSGFPGVPGAVREWCINSAAVDPGTKSVIINCEDGHCYRWSLVTNALTEDVFLASPTAEAYTPTLIGPDGTSYAINDATLNAVGK